MKKGKPALLPQIVLLGITSTKLVKFLHEGDCSRKANCKSCENFLNFECLIQFYLTNLYWINKNMKFICSPFEVYIKISKSCYTGLNYRFTGNLHVHEFSTYETEIMNTSKDFTTSRTGTGRWCKKVCVAFLPWQPDLIKTLPTGAISRLMIRTREPIPTYTLLNPVSLLRTWHFKHGVYGTSFPFPRLIIS